LALPFDEEAAKFFDAEAEDFHSVQQAEESIYGRWARFPC
jgi:hypothetical protein